MPRSNGKRPKARTGEGPPGNTFSELAKEMNKDLHIPTDREGQRNPSMGHDPKANQPEKEK